MTLDPLVDVVEVGLLEILGQLDWRVPEVRWVHLAGLEWSVLLARLAELEWLVALETQDLKDSPETQESLEIQESLE